MAADTRHQSTTRPCTANSPPSPSFSARALTPVGRASWLLVLLLVLAACAREQQPAGASRVDTNARPSAKSSAVSPPRASVAPAQSGSHNEVERSLDLLHRTASIVVTSSHADGNSTGAYLVDELPDTSWKPNPPDHEPWIEIDLPALASIERVELIVARGSNVSPEPLLRAASILVPGSDARLRPHPVRRSIGARGELVLEPESVLDLTRLRLALSGAPRGLRIAELRAIGAVARSELLEPAIPETRVQGNARVDYNGALFAAWVLGAPYATEDALCQAFIRLLPVDPERSRSSGELCRKLPQVAIAGTAPPQIRAVQRFQLSVPDQVSPTETTALVVRTEGGLYPANLALADTRNEGMCPGGPEGDMSVSNFRYEHGVLLIDRARYFTPGILQDEQPHAPPPAAAVSALRCSFEKRLLCREFITHFGTPDMLVDDNGPPYRVKLPAIWDWTRTVSISRRGSVRLTPCRTPDRKDHASRIVPCASPGSEVL